MSVIWPLEVPPISAVYRRLQYSAGRSVRMPVAARHAHSRNAIVGVVLIFLRGTILGPSTVRDLSSRFQHGDSD
jgi:hypothetical protein